MLEVLASPRTLAQRVLVDQLVNGTPAWLAAQLEAEAQQLELQAIPHVAQRPRSLRGRLYLLSARACLSLSQFFARRATERFAVR